MVLDSQWFTLITTMAILANLITLAMDRHPISNKEKAALETANLAFTIVFAVEMAMKLLGMMFIILKKRNGSEDVRF